MTTGLRDRLRSRRVRIALLVVVVAVAAVIAGVVAAAGPSITTRAQFVTGTPENGKPVDLDTTLYLPASTPAPAVLLSQGFGGDKTDLDSEARTFAEHGYVVLAYSARGFGQSGGLIHFAAPNYEVHDAKLLVDYLALQPQVERVNGRPQIAAAGASYGGAISLLLAAADPQVTAVAADITWSNLEQAFYPNAVGTGPGVFHRLWIGQLFANAFPPITTSSPMPGSPLLPLPTPSSTTAPTPAPPLPVPGGTTSCGRLAPSVCAAYQASARLGAPTAAMRALLKGASPSTVLDHITVPTLLTQGEQDSLFPLSQADANAHGIAAHGTPVRVVWRPGGHDNPGVGSGVATTAAIDWFDEVFHGHVSRHQPFLYTESAGIVSAATGDAAAQTLQADGYPGLAGTPRPTRLVTVAGPPQQVNAPAGGVPAAISSIPGVGGLSSPLAQTIIGLPSAPGQTAYFASGPLTSSMAVAGQPTVRITVTTHTTRDLTLFAAVRDLSPEGAFGLPGRLVAPIHLTGLTPGQPRTVTVKLPMIVHNFLAGHRMVLTVTSTDFAYQLPTNARSYTIALPGGSAPVTVPTGSGTPVSAGHPVAWLIAGIAVCLLIGGAVGFIIVRRRRVVRRIPELADVPVHIASLTKEYAGGYRAVDDVTFRVEPGQVVGLLGPNGAGKTTTLRVLVGLITPTSGEVHVFGDPVLPGAAVLARLGAFIEGPGFLPHLTGRENLRLYWAATGRPPDDGEFATALDIAGLGPSVDRRVRTYSHGMRQRLGIAQAMLGLPELLVLDEPTNGLDPPQIAEMREVLRRYAQTGRTVVVSSHLLAEVEQTCTHVVVMHKGRLVAAGSVAEIAGARGMQLAVDDTEKAQQVLAAAGIAAEAVPARRALEDVFLDLIGGDESPHEIAPHRTLHDSAGTPT